MAAGRLKWVAFAVVMLGACSSQRDPAQGAIIEIDAVVMAAATDAAKYVPGELLDVQTHLGELKVAFDKGNYVEVRARAPTILSEANGLAGAAALKKQKLTQALDTEWAQLVTVVPGYASAIQNRIDALSGKANGKPAAGTDLNAAKRGLREAASIWSKAQAAFATGNMEEAVTTAAALKSRLENLAAALSLNLNPAGA